MLAELSPRNGLFDSVVMAPSGFAMVRAAPPPPVVVLPPPPVSPEQAVSASAAATPSAIAGNFTLMVSPLKRDARAGPSEVAPRRRDRAGRNVTTLSVSLFQPPAGAVTKS